MGAPVRTFRSLTATIRGRRQSLGLTQAQVASRAGVSRQWLSEFESGKPTAELGLFLRLAEALDLDLRLDARSEALATGDEASITDLDALLESQSEGTGR